MKYTPMNPWIKEQWVEALRSGRYAQGRRALRRAQADGPDQYCCLGVLCDLHGSAWSPAEHGGAMRYGRGDDFETGSYLQVPKPVRDWAGLGALNKEQAKKEGPCGHLAHLNDNGCGFAAIADWIEANL